MKEKLIVPNSKEKRGFLESIILLILGVVLVTNSSSIVTLTFQIIGAFIIAYGIYKILRYISLKKQFKIEETETLTTGIITTAIGLILILVASILEVGLRYILGFYLILNGLSKVSIALQIKDSQSKIFISNLTAGIIFILIGLYTIFVANAALILIGIILIVSSIYDIIIYIKNKR